MRIGRDRRGEEEWEEQKRRGRDRRGEKEWEGQKR